MSSSAAQVVVLGPAAGGAAGGAAGQDAFLLPVDLLGQGRHVVRREVHIGNGGEEALQQQPPGGPVGLAVAAYGPGQADQRAGQLVLEPGRLRRFPADAPGAGAAGAAGGLLTLKAKHRLFHEFLLVALVVRFEFRDGGQNTTTSSILNCASP